MQRKIILASESANRRAVMDALHIPYEVIPANLDEKAIRDNNNAARVEKLARAKAEKIALDHPDAIILGGDSYAVNNGRVFEKPTSIDEAREMLRQQSGGKGILYVGFCYLDAQNQIDFSTTIEVSFSLRIFNDAEIEHYIKAFPVLTWSGALYAGNVYGAGMIKEVHGSLSAFLYGFPTDLVIEYLQKSGIEAYPRML